MTLSPTPFGSRAVALYLTGFAAFIGLYLPQPILPRLAKDFGVSVQTSSLLISATIFGIALASPLVGVLADRFGRRRILIVSSLALGLVTFACALAPSYGFLVSFRLLQGLLLPGLFAVGVAYVSDTLPPNTMNTVAGIYVAATVVGGMLGRIIAGVLTDYLSWRYGFGLSALLYVGVVALWLRLPRLADGENRRRLKDVFRGTLSHFGNRAILGGLGIGFCLFFAFQAIFTYLPFRLERAPFNLSATVIGLTYLSYTSGVLSSSLAGWLRSTLNLKLSLGIGFVLAILGNLMSLSLSLWLVFAGLLVVCFGNFLVQGLAVGLVATASEHDRAGANALYLLLYYLGGSLGAFLPGYLFTRFGYGGVIAAGVAALALGLTSTLLLTGQASTKRALEGG